MSIATALSSLRKRERAIRTGLLTKGYDVGYPYKYDNDTSAIISVLGGINGRNSVRNAAIKAMAEGPEGADSVILDDGILDLRGFYNKLSTIQQRAFAESGMRKIVFPYLGRHLSAMMSAFVRCDSLTAVEDSFIPATDDFDPADPTALCASLLYTRHAGVVYLSNYAFASCMNLLETPAFTNISVIYFGNSCFRECSALTSLGGNAYNAPNSYNWTYVFAYSGLTGIDYTDFSEGNYSARMFGTYAFAYCDDLVSAYMRYPNFSSNTFRACPKLSVIQLHSNDSIYNTNMLGYTGTNMLNGCTNLLCVDCSHFGVGKVTNVTASHLTAGNTAKWVFGRSMESQLTGTWLSNATLHSRVVIVDDPKELMIKYDDGTVFEYSFAQLSSTFLSGNQGITGTNWLSAVRDELLAHGPLSNIVEISASQFFNNVSPNFLNCGRGSTSTKLSAVYFPCALRHGLKSYAGWEGYTNMLAGQRNIKDLLSAFPNLVYCDGMELYQYNNTIDINIGGVALPKAKYVFNFLGGAVAEYYDLPEARLVGGILDGDHLKYVYTPKAEAIVVGTGRNGSWISKLSGVSLSDIKTLYTTFDNGAVNMPYMIQTFDLHPAALSNVENICHYRYYNMYPEMMTIDTDVAFPKLKMIRLLQFPNKPTEADVLSGVNLNGLQCIDEFNMWYLSTDCDVELPSLQYAHQQIYANGRSITAYTEARHKPHLINLKFPNLLSARGIVPCSESDANRFETKYTDSQVSIVFDFSGKTAQSADGKVHPPVLTFDSSWYTGSGRYHNALSTFNNLYKSVRFIFDRELSAEVLEDTPTNHWRYNANGVKWPDSLISCYQFV